MTESHQKLAGFWIRSGANALDTIIVTIVASLPGYPLDWLGMSAFYIQIVMVVLYSLLSFAYYTWGHHRYGMTLGKWPFKIYVIDRTRGGLLTLGKSALRSIAYVASWLPFGAGFLMVAWHPEKRALHDLLAGSLSVISPQRAVRDPGASPTNPAIES